MADVAAISKLYKLDASQAKGGKGPKKSSAMQVVSNDQVRAESTEKTSNVDRHEMGTSILAMMALKGS